MTPERLETFASDILIAVDYDIWKDDQMDKDIINEIIDILEDLLNEVK